MKILRILLSTSLIFPIALVANSGENCKSGINGKNGENGENGENGGFYGGNGGNGGNGGFFGGNGGNGGNGGKRGSRSALAENPASGQVDEYEYKALIDACRTMIAKVEEHLTGNGSLSSITTQHIFKSELSNYLLSLGTPASRKLYEEYEAVEWKYPAIKGI